MSGLRPAVIGLIGSAVISIGMTVLFPAGIALSVFSGIAFYVSLAIFAAMTVLVFCKVHPIIIICISAVLGIICGFTGLI